MFKNDSNITQYTDYFRDSVIFKHQEKLELRGEARCFEIGGSPANEYLNVLSKLLPISRENLGKN